MSLELASPAGPLHIAQVSEQLPTMNEYLRQWRALTAIKRVVVHIDDVYRPDAAYNEIHRLIVQANYHISGRNWNPDPKGQWIPGFGLMYHFRVAGNGEVFQTQPLSLITWHASSWNYEALAICCDAAAAQEPTDAQLDSLRRLLLYLCYHRPDFPAGRKDVYGHTEEPSTTKSCPAKFLPYVQKFRKGEW